MRVFATLLTISMILAAANLYAEPANSSVGKIAESADKTTPIQVGAPVPDVKVRTADGTEIALKEALDSKPAIIVFYRGHWCPYCMTHLQGLQKAYDEIQGLGYSLFAISPNTPEKLTETDEKLKMDYQLFSDSSMDAAKAFGIAFQVDDETIEKYKGYGIDLVASSGEKHNALPVPGIFIVDKEGIIQFSHANPDYSQRLDNETLLKEAKAAIK